MFESEYMKDVPYGLIMLGTGGRQTEITGISPVLADLRTGGEISSPLRFSFFRFDAGEYEIIEVDRFAAEEPRDGIVRVCIPSCPGYSKAVRRTQRDYAEYVSLRAEGDFESIEAKWMRPRPGEGTCASVREQIAEWTAGAVFPDTSGRELAVSLKDPVLLSAYAEAGSAFFPERYAELCGIPAALLPERGPDRIYIGSEHCPLLFPDEGLLKKALRRAEADGIRITVCPPKGFDPGVLPEGELIAQDWGALYRLREHADRFALLLGTKLNKYRKDPRLPFLNAFSGREELLRESGVNDAAVLAFLKENGIARIEYEACGRPLAPAELPSGLHLPYYTVSSSVKCPLRAICLSGARARQTEDTVCARYCGSNALLYERKEKLLGLGNRLVSFDIPVEIPPGFDRIVLNFERCL